MFQPHPVKWIIEKALGVKLKTCFVYKSLIHSGTISKLTKTGTKHTNYYVFITTNKIKERVTIKLVFKIKSKVVGVRIA